MNYLFNSLLQMTVGDLIALLQEKSGGDMQMKVNVGYKGDDDIFCKFDIDIVDGAVPLISHGYSNKGCQNPEVFIYFYQEDAHQTDN